MVMDLRSTMPVRVAPIGLLFRIRTTNLSHGAVILIQTAVTCMAVTVTMDGLFAPSKDASRILLTVSSVAVLVDRDKHNSFRTGRLTCSRRRGEVMCQRVMWMRYVGAV